MAVCHLRDKIPELATQIEEGLNFVAEGASGTTVIASRRQGRWRTKTRKRDGNHLEMDPNNAMNYLRNKLKKQGLQEGEIESWAKRFENCESGHELQVPTGETFVKNEGTVRLPQLTEQFVDDRLPVLIAYEFLALCLGEKIFGPDFNAIRDYIRFGTKTDQVGVLNKRTHQYSPDHIARFRIRDNTLTVFIQFFRWYVFEIRFCDIPMPSEEIVYVEDLKNRQRLIALSSEDAKRGNWEVL